jgi:hypothetical protein
LYDKVFRIINKNKFGVLINYNNKQEFISWSDFYKEFEFVNMDSDEDEDEDNEYININKTNICRYSENGIAKQKNRKGYVEFIIIQLTSIDKKLDTISKLHLRKNKLELFSKVNVDINRIIYSIKRFIAEYRMDYNEVVRLIHNFGYTGMVPYIYTDEYEEEDRLVSKGRRLDDDPLAYDSEFGLYNDDCNTVRSLLIEKCNNL